MAQFHHGRDPPDFRRLPAEPRAPLPSRDAHDVAEIHQRLDSITRQIEQISRPAARSEPPAVARQLNDAISRLDARLSQISKPAPQQRPSPQPDPQRQSDRVERAAGQVYRASPPLSPGSLDSAIAEIAARQNELDGTAPRLPPRSAPPIAPAAPAPPPGPGYFRASNGTCLKITSQIEALQRPDGIEQSIAAFRGDLAEIRTVITEAMPRRAIRSIENEIRSLSRRIDETRQSGIDDKALAGIERALGEIHVALRSLTPAEQLAGFDEAIRNLGGKIDLIVRSSDDPGTLHKLEDAISALRAIVSNVASNDTLGRLSDDLRTLSSKVGQLSRADSFGDGFAALEQRIATLTSTLENRERPAPRDDSDHLEGALRALSDRLDHLQVGNDSAAAFTHLEQRISYLLERLEMSAPDSGSGNLGRVEEGLQDVLQHLIRQQSSFAHIAALAETGGGAAAPMDSGLVDTIKRELSDMRFSQTETDRHTQDSLEVVHNTLGHVVDRLALIEGDLRAVRAAPTSAAPQSATPPRAEAPRAAMQAQPASPPPLPRPELPNPAAAHFDAAPRQFGATSPSPLRHGVEDHQRHSRSAADGRKRAPRPSGSGTARTALAYRHRSRSAAGSSARTGYPPAGADGIAIGAHRRFRRRHQRNLLVRARTGQHVEFHRRRAARGASRRDLAVGRQAGPHRQTRRQQDARGQGTFEHYREDSLASGRRECRRDRARHLQDGDDAAGHRTHAAGTAAAPEISSEATPLPLPPPPAESAVAPAPAPAPARPSMTSPTPIGKQSLVAPAPKAAGTVHRRQPFPAVAAGCRRPTNPASPT